MKLEKVLVVHKKSTYQIQAQEHKEARFLKLMESGSDVVSRVRLAHEEHVETLELVESELRRLGISFQSLWRSQVPGIVEDIDLMISVGGDGTFLDASHALRNVPILGVNSSCSSSFGHFCLANKDNFQDCLEGIIDERLHPIDILRLELSIDGVVIQELALNEVLIAHSSPAATSRYFINVDGRQEEQRSSGIWVSTPAGSTGSMRSAGGQVSPIDCRSFEYLVREPYTRPGENFVLLNGMLDQAKQMKVKSMMRTGEVYIDGPHIIYPLSLGEELTIKASPYSLRAFIDRHVNDIFNKVEAKAESTSCLGENR
ncbi:MAG: NAD(+)/NADH kinase [Candidatus Obscuribacter phosphatis]|uniref:NAD(+)/NADH kinase n=1 Tax=Candidatus Obscuribacter phosphatis TaxID=1906157 RepID=A0A8J7TP49_9BACT|nr:NAD(+)/NADH kinase [Candidatus Obscuribacter phosphatis]